MGNASEHSLVDECDALSITHSTTRLSYPGSDTVEVEKKTRDNHLTTFDGFLSYIGAQFEPVSVLPDVNIGIRDFELSCDEVLIEDEVADKVVEGSLELLSRKVGMLQVLIVL